MISEYLYIALFTLMISSPLFSFFSWKIKNVISFIIVFISLALVIFLVSLLYVYPSKYLNFTINEISFLFLIVNAIVSFAVSLYSYSYGVENKFLTAFLIFSYSMDLMYLSSDILTLYIFFEISAIVSIYLISYSKGLAFEASFKYYVLSIFSSSFIIGGIACYGSNFLIPLKGTLNAISTILFFVGFGTKSALFPFHAWLPDAHSEAPTPISAMLSGPMLNTGAYGILMTITPVIQQTSVLQTIFLIIGGLTIFLGSSFALTQKDVKRALAYSSIGQLGYIVTSFSLGTYAGIIAGIFYAIVHASTKALLFLSSGVAVKATGSREIDKMGGLKDSMPFSTWTFGIGAWTLSGLPPFPGFFAKIFVLYALVSYYTVSTNPSIIFAFILALVSTFITMTYTIRRLWHGIYLGESKDVKFKESVFFRIPEIILSTLILSFTFLPFMLEVVS